MKSCSPTGTRTKGFVSRKRSTRATRRSSSSETRGFAGVLASSFPPSIFEENPTERPRDGGAYGYGSQLPRGTTAIAPVLITNKIRSLVAKDRDMLATIVRSYVFVTIIDKILRRPSVPPR